MEKTIGDPFEMAYAYFLATCVYLHRLFTNTRFEYWLLNPQGQYITVSFFVMVLCFGMAFSMGFMQDIKDGWKWMMKEVKVNRKNIFIDLNADSDLYIEFDEQEQDDDEGDLHTPFHSSLNTPGTILHPQRLFPTSSTRTFNPAIDSINLAPPCHTSDEHRTGRPSTPGYQTPFAAAATGKKLSLQKEGLLNENGTLGRRTAALGPRKIGGGDRAGELAMDDGARARMRREALGRMNTEGNADRGL